MIRNLKTKISVLLLGAALSIGSPAVSNGVDRWPKELCALAPPWAGENVQYSKKLKKSGKPMTYQEWARLFQSKLVYDYDSGKFVLWTAANRIDGKTAGNPAAYLLGKVTISGAVCGLLVLEAGYYDKTRICLYPVLDDGTPLRGLVLADYWADDGDEIVIKGKIAHPVAGKTVVEVKLNEVQEEEDSGKVLSRNTISFSFPFDKKQGFVYADTKK